jgi:hypothetical protein
MLKYQKRSTDKIIIFGNNAQNHSVYRSDNKNEKIIVGKISNQEAQVLYTKNILYKNEECSQNFITEIITNCIQKKYSTFIVINTNDDNLNLSICNDFIKSMNIMDEKNRVLCYSKLRIFTFGDPKLEKIYEDVVENGWVVPLTGRTMVNKKDMIELLKEIRVMLPDEIKQAKWIKEERQRFLFEAQQEANNLLQEAESRISSMIDESEITRKSYEQANETIINAQKTAREIKEGSLEYADNILSKMEDVLKEAYLEIHKNKEELKKN